MYRITFIFCTFFTFSILCIAQPCLLADYPFNGNAIDETGNGNNGIVNGATLVADRYGNPNAAFSFDGVDDFISIPSESFLLDEYTYSMWVKLASVPSDGGYYCVMQIGHSGGNDQVVTMANDPSFSNIGWSGGSWAVNGTPHSLTLGTIPNIQEWSHVVFTRSNNQALLYINGIVVDDHLINEISAAYGNNPLATIGSRLGIWQFYHGIIDDIKIFGCVLSKSEIEDLYNPNNNCGTIPQGDSEFTCPNTYAYTLQFQNNTEEEVTSVVLNGITPDGVTLSSQFFNFYQDPIQPGEASVVVEVEIQLDDPLEEAQEVCFDVIYLTDGDQCCHYEHCVLLEPVDPCLLVSIEAIESEDNCCYEITPTNNFCPDFFTGIRIESLTDGVIFTSFTENGGWTATPNDEMTSIIWSVEGSNLPLGSLEPISFCLGGIASATQIPQMVSIYWIAIDPATGEEVVYCKEMLEFQCEPCIMLDGMVECTDAETYSYNFSMTNNSDHIGSMIVLEVHTPGVVFDPPFMVTTLNPGDSYTSSILITSEDGNQLPANTVIEFKAILYDAEGWCCHLDDVIIELPNCEDDMTPEPEQIPISTQELMIFPVPANSGINLKIPLDGNYIWSIFTANGNLVESDREYLSQSQAKHFEITGFPGGIFFIQLKHENGTTYQGRFVKIE